MVQLGYVHLIPDNSGFLGEEDRMGNEQREQFILSVKFYFFH